MKRYIKTTNQDADIEYFYIKTFMNKLEVSDASSGSLQIMNRIAEAEYHNDPRWHVFVACGSFDSWVELRRNGATDMQSLKNYNIEIPQDGFDSDSVSPDDSEYYMKKYNEKKEEENNVRLQPNFKGNYRI